MKFFELAEYFEKLEETPSRLEMTALLAELFGKVSEEEISVVVNLSLGQLRPKFDRLEFNLAEKMVMRAIALAFGLNVEAVRAEYKKVGDLGGVVGRFRIDNLKSQEMAESEGLGILGVYERLVEIATDQGQGSQERKVAGLAELFRELDEISGKYVGRMVVGKLRLGFSDMTILDALSWMETGGKEKRKQLEGAYQISPDIGKIARLVKQFSGDEVEERVEVELGVPVIPALAQRLKSADEMVKKMGKVTVEPKYDGTRVQIHFRRGGMGREETKKEQDSLLELNLGMNEEVRTFTRNLDETSEMFPELMEVGTYLKAEEVILDSEGVGIDPETGTLRPFQETIQRKRKHGIAAAAKEIPIKFFVYDILYKDGKSLVKLPFSERRQILEETVVNGELLEVPEVLVTEKAEAIREYHAHQLAEGLEGAMVKKWDGVYEPGRRGWSWVKFKEIEGSAAKLSDTVDPMVLGYYAGRGKRSRFGIGAFLVGVRGEGDGFEEGKFYSVSKIGTGLTDEQWREMKSRADKLAVNQKPKEYEVDKNLAADVWLTPGLVVEIAADEITKSPIHTAKLALRFPRLVRFRDDKDPEQATSVEELKRIV